LPQAATDLTQADEAATLDPERQPAAAEPTLGLAPEPARLTAVPTVPGYEILEELGRGGMGVVYKARHVRLNRIVALKMVLGGAHAGTADRARFRAEAEAVAHLQHANIVRIYNVGDQGGRHFLSLEYVDGGHLGEKLAGGPLPPAAAARLIEVLARAVHFAHERGILHRDLKPANILLALPQEGPSDGAETVPGLGTPKIADFGLAKRLDAAQGQTRTGTILGTPSYMAPEQAQGKGKGVGPAVDVYALGAILYECLTGRPPFKAETPLETIVEVLKEEPVSPRQVLPKLPRDLETICLKCLHKEPTRRYASAGELADDLRRFSSGEPIRARRTPAWERAVKWARRRPLAAGLVALLLVALAAGVFGYGPTALRLATNRGRLVVHTEDPDARVTVNRGGEPVLTIQGFPRDGTAQRQVELPAGEYELVLDAADGVELSADRVVLGRDGLVSVEIRHEFVGGLRSFEGNTGPVRGVAFSPDGRLALSCAGAPGTDHSIRLWEVASGETVGTLEGHAGGTEALACSPAGAPGPPRAISGGVDRMVRLWDLEGRKQVGAFKGHTGSVQAVAFSPDGKRALSGGADRVLILWDVETGKELRRFKGHTGAVTSVAISPDGRLALSGGQGRHLRLWDLESGQELPRFGSHPQAVLGVAFSPDGQLALSACEDGVVRCWDVATGRLLRRLLGHSRGVSSVAFSPDGRQVLTGSFDGSVRLWDAASGQERAHLTGHTNGVLAVAFSPDGRRALSGGGANDAGRRTRGRDFSLRLWALSRPVREALPETPQPPGELFCLRADGGQVRSVLFSLDGTSLFTGSTETSVHRWDAGSGAEKGRLTEVPHPAWPPGMRRPEVSCLALSPDGKRLLVSSETGLVLSADAASGKELRRLSISTGPIRSLAFTPDGRRFGLLAQYYGWIQVFDAATSQQLPLYLGQSYTLNCFALLPPGRLLTGGQDGIIRLVEGETGKELRRFVGHTDQVLNLAVTADGRRAVSAGQDGSVRLWDLQTGKQLRRMSGHQDAVNAVALTPDGRRALSGDRQGSVRLWDLATGAEIARYQAGSSPVTSVAIAPDGRRAASAGQDEAAHVWLLPDPAQPAPPAPSESVDMGRLVVRCDEPGVALVIRQGGKGLNAIPADSGSVDLPAGGYELGVFHSRAGLRVVPSQVTVRRGERIVVRVEDDPTHVGLVRQIPPDGWALCRFAFCPDGRHALVTNGGGEVRRLDVRTGTKVWARRAHTGNVLGLTLSRDGKRALTGGGDQVLRLWDALEGKELRSYPAFGAEPVCVALHPDGRHALANGSGAMLVLWDLQTGKEVRRFEGQAGAVLRAVFSGDGKQLASSTDDGDVRLWDVATGKTVRRFQGHRGAVPGLALSGDGKQLLTGGQDGTARLWDAADGKELSRFAARGGPVKAVALSPDGRYALCGCGDNSVRFWQAGVPRELYRIENFGPAGEGVDFGPDGPDALSGGGQGLFLWQLPMPRDGVASRQLPGQLVLEADIPQVWLTVRTGDYTQSFFPHPPYTAMTLPAGTHTIEVPNLGSVPGVPSGPGELRLSSRKVTLSGGDQQVVRARWVPLLFPPRGPTRVREAELALEKLLAREADAREDRDRLRADALDLMRTYAGLPAAAKAAALLGRLPSPLDRLEAEDVPPDAPEGVVAVLSNSRLRHLDGAYAVAFSPDGKTLASGGKDGLVCLWEAASGKRLHAFAGQAGPVRALAFSPDGKTLVAGGPRETKIRLWDVETGKARLTLSGPEGGFQSLAFDPTGGTLATSGVGAVRLWETGTGKCLHVLAGPGRQQSSVAFAADGKTLMAIGALGGVKLYDVATGKERGTSAGQWRLFVQAAVSPDGKTLASIGPEGGVSLWDLKTGKCQRSLTLQSSQPAQCVAFRPDGKALATGHGGGAVRVWGVATGSPWLEYAGHTGMVTGVVFSPDGKTLASSGADGSIRLWDAAPGLGRLLGNLMSGRVEAEAGRELPVSVGRGGAVRCAALSPDGTTVALGGEDGTVRLWLAQTGKEQRALSAGPHFAGNPIGFVAAVAFSPDGKTLAAGYSNNAREGINLWDLAADKARLRELPVWPVSSFAFSPDGKHLAVVQAHMGVQIWDPVRARQIRSFWDGSGMAHPGPALFSPDGREVAWGGPERSVKIYEATTGQARHLYADQHQPQIAFSPDGRRVATGGTEGTVKLWDASGTEEPRTLADCGDAVGSLAFRPDGKVVAAACRDGRVRFWDTATGAAGKVLQVAPAGTGAPQIAFSPDGRYLLAVNATGTAYLIRLAGPRPKP
jgi:WD40 repeat protein